MSRCRICGVFFLTMLLAMFWGTPEIALCGEAPAVDYQRVADTTPWRWSEVLASPLYCASQSGPKYDVRLANDHANRSKLGIEVLNGGKRAYAWVGHLQSVFSIVDDKLYYAEFSTVGSGGDIVAVDLATGRQLWKTRLVALGPIAHSAYHSEINLFANDRVVYILGNESRGRYIEIKSGETGETLGHKNFPENAPAKNGARKTSPSTQPDEQ